MYCCISKKVPIDPVISKKSGHLYERRLIVKYIEEHGTDPMTGDTLALEDLMEIKGGNASAVASSGEGVSDGNAANVPPRATNAASIPGMLQTFQNEWDALMLETFTLKQHLETVRQELSHALYQHDAACRVIARLVKERDDARMTIARSGLQTAPERAEGDAHEYRVDLSQDVVSNVTQTAEKLSAARRRRKVQRDLLPMDTIGQFGVIASNSAHRSQPGSGILCVDVHPTDANMILSGGMDNDAVLYDKNANKTVCTLSGHQNCVNDVLFHPTLDILFTCSDDNTARIWVKNKDQTAGYRTSHILKQHVAPVKQMTLHPSNDYILTSSMDSTWALYDVATGVHLTQSVPDNAAHGFTSARFHPDGLIFGTGTGSSEIRIWDIKTQDNVKTFYDHKGAVTSMSFSENGYYLATGSLDGTVRFWDLRKLENLHTLDLGVPVHAVQFDHSGVFCAAATEKGFQVYQAKSWSEMLAVSDVHGGAVKDVAFGPNAQFIATASLDNVVRVFGSSDSMSDE